MVERVRCPRCSTVFPVLATPRCPHCGLAGRVRTAPSASAHAAAPTPDRRTRPAARERVVAAVALVALLLLAGLVTALVYDAPAPAADVANGVHAGGAGSPDGPGDGPGPDDGDPLVPEPRIDPVGPNATVGGDGPAGPAPAALDFRGSGDEVTDAFTTERGLLRVSLTYLGEETFGVTFVHLDDGNASRRLLYASGRGDYEGVRYVGLPAGRYALDVHGAGGAWEVRVEQPRVQDAPAAPRQWTGSGDDLGDGDRVFTAQGELTFHAAHSADLGEFVVRLYDANGNLVRRGDSEAVVSLWGSGSTSVRVALPAEGTYFVDVQAAGGWSLEVSR